MRSVKIAIWEAVESFWTEGNVMTTQPVWLASEELDAFCYSYIFRIRDKIHGH